mmetsp:Transcript_22887/g.67577  ORF Transcript_22887/g.67577 Transcript_22887/m.67577 type:complete len:93 (+) Transcript_22887:161-439(+)
MLTMRDGLGIATKAISRTGGLSAAKSLVNEGGGFLGGGGAARREKRNADKSPSLRNGPVKTQMPRTSKRLARMCDAAGTKYGWHDNSSERVE